MALVVACRSKLSNMFSMLVIAMLVCSALSMIQSDEFERSRRVVDQGALRIRNSSSNLYSGRLEIQLITDNTTNPATNSWFTICKQGWSDTAAALACQQLGLTGGTTIAEPNNFNGGAIVGRKVANFNCNQGTHRLVNCPHLTAPKGSILTSQQCSDSNVFITCDQPTDYTVRLRNVATLSGDDVGVVEFYHGGQWGTICDDGWTDRESNAVCRQLGYGSGFRVNPGSGITEAAKIRMDGVRCKRKSKSLSDCTNHGMDNDDCGRNEKVGLHCINSPSPKNQGEIRLNNRRSNFTGRLEMSLITNFDTNPVQRDWFYVCSNNWTDQDSAVACRQLGLGVARDWKPTRPNSIVPSGIALKAVTNFKCKSSVHRLYDCEHDGAAGQFLADGSCDGKVYLSCTKPTDYSVRLQNVPGLVGDNTGVVEFFKDGQWGTICDDHWTTLESNTMCKQLGYDNGTQVRPPKNSLRGTYPILLDRVSCNSKSTGLGSCKHSPVGLTKCGGYEKVGVICFPGATTINTVPSPKNQGALRMNSTGLQQGTGRLEIELITDNSVTPPVAQYFPVCNAAWTDTDSKIACRQLGMHGGTRVPGTPEGFRGSTLFGRAVTNFDCQSHTYRLNDCPHTGSGLDTLVIGSVDFTNCNKTSGWVFLKCDVPKNFDVRLKNLPNLMGDGKGIIEFFYNNVWGSICDDGWSLIESKTICKQLGYNSGSTARRTQYVGSNMLAPLMLDEVKCPPNSTSLSDCHHSGVGLDQHNCGRQERVGVSCFDEFNGTTTTAVAVINIGVEAASPTTTIVAIVVTLLVLLIGGVGFLVWRRLQQSKSRPAFRQLAGSYNDEDDDDELTDAQANSVTANRDDDAPLDGTVLNDAYTELDHEEEA